MEPPQTLDDAQLATLRRQRKVELHKWGILKELLFYLFYAGVIFTMSFENKDPNGFRTYECLKNMLESTEPKVEQVSA